MSLEKGSTYKSGHINEVILNYIFAIGTECLQRCRCYWRGRGLQCSWLPGWVREGVGWPRPLVSSSGLTPLASTTSPLTWVCMYYAYNIRTYNSQAIKVTGVALWHTNQQFRPRRKVKQFRWLLHSCCFMFQLGMNSWSQEDSLCYCNSGIHSRLKLRLVYLSLASLHGHWISTQV